MNLFIVIFRLYLYKDQEATLYLSATNPQIQSVRDCQDSLHKRNWHNALGPLRSQPGALIRTLL